MSNLEKLNFMDKHGIDISVVRSVLVDISSTPIEKLNPLALQIHGLIFFRLHKPTP
jgi:hypothetical protein